jgi:hypothetical protein
VTSKRLQNENLDRASLPPAFFRGFQQTLQQLRYLSHGDFCPVMLMAS